MEMCSALNVNVIPELFKLNFIYLWKEENKILDQKQAKKKKRLRI